MHKIVKSFGYGYSVSENEPVAINNEIYIPALDEPDVDAEEIKQREVLKKREEQKRFEDAVDAEVKKVLGKRAAKLDAEQTAIIEEAKKSAASLTADAKATTISVLDKTSKECALLKAQAENEGYDSGYQKGYSESMEKCKKYLDSIAKLLADINSRKEAYYISNEKELKETVNVMVEKIVKAELEVNPLVIERIIADAAKNFRNSDYLKISVAEGELTQKIKTDKNFMNKIIPFIKDIEVEIIDDVPLGTIILDDDENIVDASVPTQLDFLKEIMKNTRGEEL